MQKTNRSVIAIIIVLLLLCCCVVLCGVGTVLLTQMRPGSGITEDGTTSGDSENSGENGNNNGGGNGNENGGNGDNGGKGNSSDTTSPKALTIHSFSESYVDTSTLTENIKVNAILKITPPVSGKEIFITDETGKLEFETIEPGTYKIQPIHAPGSYAKEITVKQGKNQEIKVPTPGMAVTYYAYNYKSDILGKKEVRQALNYAIDRSGFLQSYLGKTEAKTFLPPLYRSQAGVDETQIQSIVSDPERANELLDLESPADLQVLSHEMVYADPDFETLRPQIEALANINTIRLNEKPWYDYLKDQQQSKFEIARVNWILDSNNMLEFFSELCGAENEQNCDNGEIQAKITEGQDALNSGDIGKYESLVIEINNLLVEELPVMPLYFYEPGPEFVDEFS